MTTGWQIANAYKVELWLAYCKVVLYYSMGIELMNTSWQIAKAFNITLWKLN